MEKDIKQIAVGQMIARVLYFDLNDPDQPFYFDGFDNFDLGFEIEMSNGFRWHVGWKENDHPEIGTGKYLPQDFHGHYKQMDATERWSSVLGAKVSDFELIYALKEWNIPAQCKIVFDNSKAVSIVLGEELNHDGSLPLPLRFVDGGEMYIFHGKELPAIDLVKLSVPVYPKSDEPASEMQSEAGIRQDLIAALVIIAILAYILFNVLSNQ